MMNNNLGIRFCWNDELNSYVNAVSCKLQFTCCICAWMCSANSLEGVSIQGTAIHSVAQPSGDVKAGASKYYRSRARYSPHHKKSDGLSGVTGVGFGTTAPRFDQGIQLTAVLKLISRKMSVWGFCCAQV